MFCVVVNIDKDQVNSADFNNFIEHHRKIKGVSKFLIISKCLLDNSILSSGIKIIYYKNLRSSEFLNELCVAINNINVDYFIFMNLEERVYIDSIGYLTTFSNFLLDVDVYFVFNNTEKRFVPRIYRKREYYRVDKIFANELYFNPNLSVRMHDIIIHNMKNHGCELIDSHKKPKRECDKSIVFTVQDVKFGGVETRISDEIKIYQELGYRVFLVIASSFVDFDIIPNDVFVLCCHKNMKIAHEWIFFQGKLRQLCEQYDIGIIYAQSSGCVLWGSAIVASLTSKPLLHTLHGHSALYESDNEHWSSFIYKFILAEHISCVYSMSEILGWMANCFGNVVVMPNVVDVDRFYPKNLSSIDERWLIIGRVDGDKLAGICNFIEFAYRSGIPGVVVVGGNAFGSGRNLVEGAYSSDVFYDYVTFMNPKTPNELNELINKFSGVAGVGRVILEGLACQKPTCVIGVNGGIRGLVTKDNFDGFYEGNFNGGNMPNITLNGFKKQLKLIDNTELSGLRDKLVQSCSLNSWKQRIENSEKYYQPFKSDFMEAIFSRICFCSDVFTIPFYDSDIFIQTIESLIYNKKFFNTHLERAFIKYKKDFNNGQFLSYPYKGRKDLSINICSPVHDGQIIISCDRFVISKNDDIINFDVCSYLRSSGRYEICIDYVVESSHVSEHDVLLSFAFKDHLNDINVDSVNPKRLSSFTLSKDKRAGFFKYLPVPFQNYEGKISINIDSDIEISQIKIVNWKLKDVSGDAYVKFKKLEINAFALD